MSPLLTPKQKAVLDFITEHAKKRGFAPSQQEIAKHFGFKSLGTVQNYLVRLERQGVLRKTWNARRGVEPHPSPTREESLPPTLLSLPLLGRVAAGRPIEAIENDRQVEIPASLVSDATVPHFVLRVSGNSMIEDGILDGDFVIVRKQLTARNGQTVVALVGNEATIKRFYQRKDRSIELRPANPEFEPLIISSLTESRDFRIEGVMVGLIRKFDQVG